MRVMLSLPLYPYTGYGRDGISITDLFLRAGADVYLDPDGVQPPLPRDIALLLTKEARPGDTFDLHLKQFDPTRLAAHPGEKAHAKLLLGWTMWEWTDLDARCSDETLAKIPDKLENFHAIACYDRNSERAVGKYTPPNVHIFQAQGGYDKHKFGYIERDFAPKRKPFQFSMYGSLNTRKGPFYAVEAFMDLRRRRPDLNVELHLKTTDAGMHPAMEQAYPGVKIYNEIWPDWRLKEFLRDTHCLLCPSLGEGKNMPALEFLASGGPVVATNWGGHTVWLSDSIAYPLQCTQVRELPTRTGERAEPSVEHLSELMEWIVDHPDEVKAKGIHASKVVPELFSWEATVQSMLNRLAADHIDGAKEVAEFLRDGIAADEHLRRAREEAANARRS